MIQKKKVYRRSGLFYPNKIVIWKEKGEKIWGTNIARMETGRAPLDANAPH
ncbi:hypothetical protein [Bartonella rattaustraliani]|uniref:hypothetical protein n=1 Tax=Bartonella rattaustraliani TaxID=481139 RepID=UPI0002FF85A2|nr:hypothetical protein [Bartonella rattaustraliani]